MMHGTAKAVDNIVDIGLVLEPARLEKSPELTLHKAIERGCKPTMRALLDAGMSSEARDKNGQTALMAAIVCYESELVQIVLERQADVEARDNEGFTPLLRAAGRGHTEILKQLLLAGADMNATGPNGYTPLSIAIQRRKLDTMEALIEHDFTTRQEGNRKDETTIKSIIDSRDPLGRTPLFLATQFGLVEIVQLLLTRGGSNAAQVPTCAG
jgi:ankyrin repeat protein